MPEQHHDGVSLKPLLIGKSMDNRPLFWYYPHYSGGLGGRPTAAIRDGNFKLIYSFETNSGELFNIKRDEEEDTELLGQYSKKKTRLSKKLQDWIGEMNVQLPYPNPSYQPEK